MKIIFLNDDFYPQAGGGATRIVLWLSRELIKRGHQVIVVTTNFEENKITQGNIQGIKVYYLPVKRHSYFWRSYFSLYNPKIIKQLKQIFIQEKPDIIHAHCVHTYAISYASLKLAKKYAQKVFFTAHDVMTFSYGKLFFSANDLKKINWMNEQEFDYKVSWLNSLTRAGKAYNPLRNLIIRHYLKYAHKIFSVSNALKNALQQNKVSQNIKVIHNSIDVSKWQNVNKDDVQKFKDQHEIKNEKIIFFGGRLSYAKGARQILKILTKDGRKFDNIDNIKVLVVGENKKFKNQFITDATKLSLENNLIFTGWLDENQMKLAYYASDLIISPSICFDTFVLVNLEAMACKKPVITTCLGGSKEVVKHNQTGYIINPYEVDKITKYVIRLLSHPELAQQMGENGYQRVIQEFTLEKQVNKLLKYYLK